MLLRLQWREVVHNTVTVGGKNDVINQYFKAGAYSASWYLGLKGSGVVSVNDTMASHPGWGELIIYSGNRPAIIWGATASGSNTASPASFAINAAATVTGSFIVSNSSPGGISGIVYSAADFSTARSVASGDILNITPTVSF